METRNSSRKIGKHTVVRITKKWNMRTIYLALLLSRILALLLSRILALLLSRILALLLSRIVALLLSRILARLLVILRFRHPEFVKRYFDIPHLMEVFHFFSQLLVTLLDSSHISSLQRMRYLSQVLLLI
ncbi:MAG: hypothetical protein ACRD5J_11810 [Nitrososphaeraceae archaeon]